MAVALDGQRLGGQFHHARSAGGVGGFQRHIVQQGDGVAVRIARFDGRKGVRHGGILAQALHLDDRLGNCDRGVLPICQRHITAGGQGQAGTRQISAGKFGQLEAAGGISGDRQSRALGQAQFAIAGQCFDLGGRVQLQAAVLQLDRRHAVQLAFENVGAVRLQIGPIQRQRLKAGHQGQVVVVIAAADVDKGDLRSLVGAGQLYLFAAAESAAGQRPVKGQVAAADCGKAETAAVHHGEGVGACRQGGQGVVARIDVGDVLNGQRGLQRQGIGQVHAGAGKINGGGLVGRHVAHPLDHRAAGAGRADLEGTAIFGIVDSIDRIVQRGIAVHGAVDAGDENQRFCLAAKQLDLYVLTFKHRRVMIHILLGAQVEGDVLGTAEGGGLQRGAADVIRQVQRKAVRHVVQHVCFKAIATEGVDRQFLNRGTAERAVAVFGGQIQAGDGQPGQAGAAGEYAGLHHIGDGVGGKLHVGQCGTALKAALPNGTDAAVGHIDGGQRRVAAESVGSQIGHVILAARILDAVRQHQVAAVVRAVGQGQSAVAVSGGSAGHLVPNAIDGDGVPDGRGIHWHFRGQQGRHGRGLNGHGLLFIRGRRLEFGLCGNLLGLLRGGRRLRIAVLSGGRLFWRGGLDRSRSFQLRGQYRRRADAGHHRKRQQQRHRPGKTDFSFHKILSFSMVGACGQIVCSLLHP